MEEIRRTSWYGKYPIIYRVLNSPGGFWISSINSIMSLTKQWFCGCKHANFSSKIGRNVHSPVNPSTWTVDQRYAHHCSVATSDSFEECPAMPKATCSAPPRFNIASEKWWLKDDPDLLGWQIFNCELLNFQGVPQDVPQALTPAINLEFVGDTWQALDGQNPAPFSDNGKHNEVGKWCFISKHPQFSCYDYDPDNFFQPCRIFLFSNLSQRRNATSTWTRQKWITKTLPIESSSSIGAGNANPLPPERNGQAVNFVNFWMPKMAGNDEVIFQVSGWIVWFRNNAMKIQHIPSKIIKMRLWRWFSRVPMVGYVTVPWVLHSLTWMKLKSI